MINTVLEIIYKDYTENVIVTSSNEEDVILMIKGDRKILDYNIVVEGEVLIEEHQCLFELGIDYVSPRKSQTINRMYSKQMEMEKVSYFHTNKEAYAWFEKIAKLERRIFEKTNLLTNKERLFI